MPEKSKQSSDKDWKIFFEELKPFKNFTIVPYYANSYEEAIQGFIYGSIDLLYINPAIFLELEKKYGAKALFYHKLPPEELEKNRAVILSRKDIKYIDQTKGLAIAFVDKNSLAGYIMPEKFLREKLKQPLDEWFSKISFSVTKSGAVNKILAGEADLAATDMWTLGEYLKKNNDYSDKIETLWISVLLPEHLVCVSRASPYFSSEHLEILSDFLWTRAKKRIYNSIPYNRRSFTFEPVDTDYIEKLRKLSKYLEIEKQPLEEKDVIIHK